MSGLAPGIWIAVEGDLDEVVLERLASHTGLHIARVLGKGGKAGLLKRLSAYNQAADRWPWVVLMDLDRDADCAPPAIGEWLPDPAAHMYLRVAVRPVEAWLMADHEAFSRALGIRLGAVPKQPETLENPKLSVVQMARRSRRRTIRSELVPRPASGRSVGPGYTTLLMEFVQNHWRPLVATERSDSLRRCILCLEQIARELE